MVVMRNGKKKWVCRPTRRILRKVARGFLKNVKLDFTTPITSLSALPPYMPLPIGLKDAWSTFATQDADHYHSRHHHRRQHGNYFPLYSASSSSSSHSALPLNWTHLILDDEQVTVNINEEDDHDNNHDRTSGNGSSDDGDGGDTCCYWTPMADFFNVAESMTTQVAEDIMNDHQLSECVTKYINTNNTERLKFDILAELYLEYRPLLYAYFVVKTCSNNKRRRKSISNNNKVHLSYGDGTALVFTIPKTRLCKSCCANLLLQPRIKSAVSVRLEPHNIITISADKQTVNIDMVTQYKQAMMTRLSQKQ